MKAVIQRVLSASVNVNGGQVSNIQRGLCVLIGIGADDTSADSDYIISKILSLRLFPNSPNPPGIAATSNSTQLDPNNPSSSNDENSKKITQWSMSVKDIQGEVLCVSQFTLMAKTKKGSKPDFHNAMGSDSSRRMYSDFLAKMKASYHQDRIKDGEFGAMMEVQILNEGPVTIILDSKESSAKTS